MNKAYTCQGCGLGIRNTTHDEAFRAKQCLVCYTGQKTYKMNKIERSKVSVGDRFRHGDNWFQVTETTDKRTYIRYDPGTGREGALYHTYHDFTGFDEYIPVWKNAEPLNPLGDGHIPISRELADSLSQKICTCGARFVKDMTHSDWCGK